MKKKITRVKLGERLSEDKTDWKRLRNMKDEDIDYSDIPELEEGFWKDAELVMPEPKKSVHLRVDADVLDWFKSQGKGHLTRMNAVLRSYYEAHKNGPVYNKQTETPVAPGLKESAEQVEVNKAKGKREDKGK